MQAEANQNKMSDKQPSLDKGETNKTQALSIAATFTIDSIATSLDYLTNVSNLDFKIDLAPYHQVFQQLLDQSSNLNRNVSGINAIVIRLEDFIRDSNVDEDVINKAEKFADELEKAMLQYSNNTKISTILALLPASPKLSGALKEKVNQLTNTLQNKINNLPGLVIVSSADLEESGFNTVSDYDDISDSLAHVPFSEAGFASLALTITRKLHLLKTPAKKVLVLDCDNTIWGGVVGEDGVDGIVISPAFIEIQKFAVKMQSLGVLICLASKNAEQDVLDVFSQRKDMVLKLEHLVSHRINWTSKYQNLESLAAELNLGLDSFVFIDDNPVECGQMQSMLPYVVTLQFPKEEEITAFLKHLWAFDKLAVTEEDAKRTQMYKENSERQKLETSVTDIGAFLSSLELVIDVGEPAEDEWSRIAQLTQRTNQFNFTTIRRNEQDVRVLNNTKSCSVLRVKVSDRFGDYGLVGVMIAMTKDTILNIDTFLLSCRVLGRGVEHAMLRKLAEIGSKAGCSTINLPYILTPKNEPAKAFADSIIEQYKTDDGTNITYSIPTDILQKTVYVPGSDPEAVLAAKTGKKNKASTNATKKPSQSPSERYEKLATIHHGQLLIKSMRAEKIRQRNLTSKAMPPTSDEERKMLALWEDVLGIEGLGIKDNFFAIGGTSLIAARLFAEIAHQFKVKLRLTTILESSTVKALVKLLNTSENTLTSNLIDLKTGDGSTLFLIHDGDGETLLYRNLASYLPENMSVIGIEPFSLPNIPMAHTSIEEMADFYLSQIKKRQTNGPYLIGGMCAGGLIAYIVAEKLSKLGDQIEIVAMLDSAVPNAKKKFGQITQGRAKGLKQLFSDAQSQTNNILSKILYIALNVTKKIFNLICWELSSKIFSLSKFIRFATLKRVLSNQKSWPTWLPQLSVREVYNSAENICELPKTQLNTLLIKATKGVGDDIPYSEVYADDDFGWRQYAQNLTIVGTEGGHASMLQEPHAKSLAKLILKNLTSNHS